MTDTIFYIGEIGINANGSVDIARKMIRMAKRCGCNAVKFQKRTIGVVYPKEMLDSERISEWGKTQREQKEGLEFSEQDYDEINRICDEEDIEWFASAWDIPSLNFLKKYDCGYNKIASPMLTHLEFVEEVAKESKLTFVSTGMCNMIDIQKVCDIFNKHKCPFILMHCTSLYPCPDSKCNMGMVKILKNTFGCHVGYSGHEEGYLPSLVAALDGAIAIERHITLDKEMYGSDQKSSIDEK